MLGGGEGSDFILSSSFSQNSLFILLVGEAVHLLSLIWITCTSPYSSAPGYVTTLSIVSREIPLLEPASRIRLTVPELLVKPSIDISELYSLIWFSMYFRTIFLTKALRALASAFWIKRPPNAIDNKKLALINMMLLLRKSNGSTLIRPTIGNPIARQMLKVIPNVPQLILFCFLLMAQYVLDSLLCDYMCSLYSTITCKSLPYILFIKRGQRGGAP